ncbi:hypothetical protein D8780_08080 [Notoacmeibacter ruber]|uniref:Uncharacterized protein n=1 Tax=Notoacmeibacter ruber TaxID=2670375 RepID=A0A3L7JCG8_9HYPH|nr:hypothetical protein D8780_08080 [Notoacmeibacter ruber]
MMGSSNVLIDAPHGADGSSGNMARRKAAMRSAHLSATRRLGSISRQIILDGFVSDRLRGLSPAA